MSTDISLMPHQHIHLWKISRSPFNGLAVFDDVGTGKTISALNIMKSFLSENESPVLIVVPPALFEKWTMEIKRWCGMRARKARISDNQLVLSPGVNLLSHGIIQTRRLDQLPEIGLLIIDEAHHFRNQETQSSKQAHRLCLASRKRVIMTATPLNNGIDDLVNVMNLVLCDIQPAVVKALVAESFGTSNPDLLYPIMTRCILNNDNSRRKITNHEVEMTERERSVFSDLISSYKDKQLSKITVMKMASSSMAVLNKFTGNDLLLDDSKVVYTSNLINSICEKGGKVIVFTEFVETAKSLSKKVEQHLIGQITGDTSADSRSAFLTGLQYSSGGVIVMTDVGGEGLDMQFVDAIINHDLPWNPMILEQRIGRLDRIGRIDNDVNVHNIILADSLDPHISQVLEEKEVLTTRFGGYGQFIENKDSLVLSEAFDFRSLTSEVFKNDAIGCATRNYTHFDNCVAELSNLIKELD